MNILLICKKCTTRENCIIHWIKQLYDKKGIVYRFTCQTCGTRQSKAY